jgi:hypothetical protein
MEVGSFSQFLTIPYETFGHLATMVTCVQLWHNTEPCGLHMCPAESVSWTPTPIAPGDQSLMEVAVKKYNKRGSAIINRCRLYVQAISVVDLLIYDTSEIHPSYLKGEIPPSRTSSILWPSYPHPPKHYWKSWAHFLHTHITPVISCTCIRWNQISQYWYHPCFYKHPHSPHLYKLQDGTLTCYPICVNRKSPLENSMNNSLTNAMRSSALRTLLLWTLTIVPLAS